MDIGIDLGTTYSVLAVPGKVELADGYPDGEYLEECDTTIIPAPDCNPTFPSVLLNDEQAPGEYIVGMEAKQAAEEGASPVTCTKRGMGTDMRFKLGDTEITAKDAAREILRYLKSCAEQALGQPVERAVITHPAYFDRSQVDETCEAAKEAGFSMDMAEQMLMEPIAAALAYVRSDKKDPLRILLYDLGGGTFDVTVLERNAGVIEVKAYDGDPLLGGYNFDRKIAQWLLEKLKDKGHDIAHDEESIEDRGRHAQLLQWAERIKEKLSNMGARAKVPLPVSCNFLVDVNGRSIQARERITQEEFVKLIEPEIVTTIECSKNALKKAGITKEELDCIILVGGSTYGPWIESAVREAFGMEPLQFRPDQCVAAGAAIQSTNLPAHLGNDRFKVILDVNSVSILPTVGVYGRVEVAESSPENTCAVLLHTPQGQTLGPVVPEESGGFGFDDVPLEEDEATEFSLQLVDANGTVQLEETFTVTYDPENADVSTISTVLPKPLYLESASGMVPLAEEGMMLPSAEISVTLTRLFDGPTQEAKVYQEGAHVGTITISDIPDFAGKDSKVTFKVQITEKNEIKGTAEVRAPRTDQIAKEGKILVKFPPIPIPELGVLQAKFSTLNEEWVERKILVQAPEEKAKLVAGRKIVEAFEEKTKEQEPNRQELTRLVREMDQLLNAREEDMDPPKSHFEGLLAACRSEIAAQGDDQQAQQYTMIVDKNEREGNEAFNTKNERKWSIVNDTLRTVLSKLRPDPSQSQGGGGGTPPTPVLKDHFRMKIKQLMGDLKHAEETRQAQDPVDYEKKWKERCQKTEEEIRVMEKDLDAIDDDTPEDQGMAKIRMVLRPQKQVEEDIENILRGMDIR